MRWIVLLNCLVWGSAFAILPDAQNKSDAEEQAFIELHKDYLLANTDNRDDDEIYYASEQYKTAKRANQFIAKAYGRNGDE